MYLIDPHILEVFTIIEHVNVGTGIICNLILLFLVKKFSRASMGTYKYLLIIFASYDIFLTTVHGTINHQVVIVNLTTFAAVSWSPFESRNMTSFYCASFTVPFTLMIIHFLYRYWAIKCPDRIILFSSKPFQLLCASFSASGFVTWYILCVFGLTGGPTDASTLAARAEYFRRYNRNVTDSYLIAEHWKDGKFNLRPALVLLCFDSIIFSCITLATTLCLLTLHHIAQAQTISAYSKYLHQKLLKTLIAQTALPVVLVYIPYFCILTLPFLAIPDYGLTSACTAFNSAFPAVDAVIVVVLMKDYRHDRSDVNDWLFEATICHSEQWGDTDNESIKVIESLSQALISNDPNDFILLLFILINVIDYVQHFFQINFMKCSTVQDLRDIYALAFGFRRATNLVRKLLSPNSRLKFLFIPARSLEFVRRCTVEDV